MERLKCIKFENGPQPEIKLGIDYQEIHMFHILVNKCRIYDKDCRARSAHYKSVTERNRKNSYRGKPYSSPADRGKQRDANEKNPSGGGTPAFVKWFK